MALLGAALPDLDSRASYVGRILRLTSDFLERYFDHRSMSHSLLVQLVAGGLAFWLLPFGFALALITGWVSHSSSRRARPRQHVQAAPTGGTGLHGRTDGPAPAALRLAYRGRLSLTGR